MATEVDGKIEWIRWEDRVTHQNVLRRVCKERKKNLRNTEEGNELVETLNKKRKLVADG